MGVVVTNLIKFGGRVWRLLMGVAVTNLIKFGSRVWRWDLLKGGGLDIEGHVLIELKMGEMWEAKCASDGWFVQWLKLVAKSNRGPHEGLVNIFVTGWFGVERLLQVI